MKKLLCVILALFMAVSLFTACGSNGDNGDNGDNGGNGSEVKSDDTASENGGSDTDNESTEGKEAVYLISNIKIPVSGGAYDSDGTTSEHSTELRFSYNKNGTISERSYVINEVTTYPDGSTDTEEGEIKLTFHYNEAGLLASVTGNNGKGIYYTYDANGFLTEETTEPVLMGGSGGPHITVKKYTNNHNGQPVIITQTLNGELESTETYSYNSDGNVLTYSQTDGNGNVTKQEEYTYDTTGRVLTFEDNNNESSYFYNDDGSYRVSTKFKSSGAVSVSEYTSDGRLTAVFDENGEMTSEVVYDENNKIIKIKEVFRGDGSYIELSRDEHGNLLSYITVFDGEKTNIVDIEYTAVYIAPEEIEYAKELQEHAYSMLEGLLPPQYR